MELSNTQLLMFLSACLGLISIQALTVFYFQTGYHLGFSWLENVNMHNIRLENHEIQVVANSGVYRYPITEVTSKGISFEMDHLPENMIIPKEVNVLFHLKGIDQDNYVQTKLTSFSMNEDGHSYKAKLEFDKKINKDLLKSLKSMATGFDQQIAA